MADYKAMRKELTFQSGGKDYTIMVEISPDNLARAEDRAKTGNGVKINGCVLFDMTTVRETFGKK